MIIVKNMRCLCGHSKVEIWAIYDLYGRWQTEGIISL